MKRHTTHWIGWVGAGMLALIVLLALIGPYVVPYDANEQTGLPFQAPGAEHWLGTNDIGQDILAELVNGARVSLFIGIVSAVLATFIGTMIGLISGYAGGWLDTVSMRIVDVSLTLPFLPLMIVVGVYMGPSLTTQVLVITLIMWAKKARELRAQTLSLRGRGAVLAARSMGAGHGYVLRRHILPAILPLIIPQFVNAVNLSIMMESALSFLGMGDPLSKSWGSMLFYANSRSAFLTDAWLWWVLPPGLCIMITVLSIAFIGYLLEERLSPRLRTFVQAASQRMGVVAGGTKASSDPSTEGHVAGNRPVLEVKNVSISYKQETGWKHAVQAISFTVHRGEVVGLVGESGSGKTTVASAIMQLLKPPAYIQEGSIQFQGIELNQVTAQVMRQLRGKRIAFIPQAAMSALNPVMTVYEQLAEAILTHRRIDKEQLRTSIHQRLEQVGLAAKVCAAYPHELSGGMRQRVIIAMALMNEPELVIADEPTTGLDVKVQVEIIKLLEELQQQLCLSMIFISHDLPVVLRLAHKVIIMNQGKIVEQGTSTQVVQQSEEPYTRRLIDAIPTLKPRVKTRDYAYAQGGQSDEA